MHVYCHAHMCDIPAARLVEKHTAEVSGAVEACDVAGDPPVCDTDERPHGPPPEPPSPPDYNRPPPSETLSQPGAEASATHPVGSFLSD